MEAPSSATTTFPLQTTYKMFHESQPEMIIPDTFTSEDYNFNVKPLLEVVENILQHSILNSSQGEYPHDGVKESMMDDHTVRFVLCDIQKIGHEVLFNGEDENMLNKIHDVLSKYAWGVKPVLALAAFAMIYGNFWLTVQMHSTNPLANSVTVLKGILNISNLSTTVLKSWFDNLHDAIKAMTDMIHSILEFYDFPSELITSEDLHMHSEAECISRTGVNWIIKTVVACATHFNSLFSRSDQYWDLSSLAFKIGRIDTDLRELLILLRLEEKKCNQLHQLLLQLLGKETAEANNTKVLSILIPFKDDKPPLIHVSTNTRVGVEALRRKTVMLLLSDLDITEEELIILKQVYNDAYLEKSERPYEMVWLPIVDNSTEWTDAKQERFNRLQSLMPWYSVHHPSLIDPNVIKFIKEQWYFDKKPLIVVLNPQGLLVCSNAMHMIWIWGIMSFPFSRKREEDLWNEEKWTIEFLIDGIDQSILTWLAGGKYICLYGGDDINWIRKFTSTMREVAHEAQVPLEMVYVGTSKNKEQVKKNMSTIIIEKLSHCWQDPMSIWFFWLRLKSMWYSKIRHRQAVENDAMMHEIVRMLTFDSSNETNGWAVIGKRTGGMALVPGWKILETLTKFDEWKDNVAGETFLEALIKAIGSNKIQEHCLKLVLPKIPGKMHEVSCSECGNPMEKYILYECCDK
ncbi:Sieve element occlusion b [Thalictrum thalictroides]|uniref:Sieve element occlusion b n=1 Tax=Thalictrum thalictroides TaxID=46969 RepID=A0A7J6WM22_THATH|nr:Sieve element occlusion b [Thalictrum thalictroides]